MIELGEMQELVIKRFTKQGAYLNEEIGEDGDVLLPKTQITKDSKIGDKVKVFIYKDSQNRTIATRKKPKISLGELGRLQVVDTTKIGTFLDWGLDKDLFLPFAETIGSVERGKEYLVGVYIDRSNRICATMKIKEMLETNSPYKENDIAEGTIYSMNRNIGAFVAVDNKYDGLIPKEEILGIHEIGEPVEVRVNKVLEDGKLDLSLRHRSYIQMNLDADVILEKMKSRGGSLNLNNKSSPEEIRERLNMSKSGFKRAVGRLLKEDMIEFTKNGIKLKE